MLFSNVATQNIISHLCEVMRLSNNENILCGMGTNQVYGNAYNALRSLLTKEFGMEICHDILENNYCDPASFDTIEASIEIALKNKEEKKNKAKLEKIKKLIIIDHGNHNALITLEDNQLVIENETIDKIDFTFDAVFEWLGY